MYTVWYIVYSLVPCIVCGTVYLMWYSVYTVVQCIVCVNVYTVWYCVYSVVLCIQCGTVHRVWYSQVYYSVVEVLTQGSLSPLFLSQLLNPLKDIKYDN